MPASPTLEEWLFAEPFALALSSGFFSFFAHAGMLSVLEERGLLPVRVSGSSAGALVGALWGAGLDSARIAEELRRVRREDFWDPGPGLGLLRGRRFRAQVERLLPVSSFAAAPLPIAVSTYDLVARKTRVLHQGPLAEAICASCAVPALFQPVWIEGRPYLDGGIADRPGIEGISRGERVLLHHIMRCSPWRLPGGASMRLPARENLAALAIADLPSVHPFALERGTQAYDQARAATQIALGRRLSGSLLQV